MAVLEYGYTSKAYPFGTVAGSGAALPTAVPTKMIVTASYNVAPSERVKIKVWNGAVSGATHLYQTVLDHGKDSAGAQTGTYVNLLDTELALGGNAPASLSAWQTIIKASITCDEATVSKYNANQPVNLYLYRDNQTGLPEVRQEPRPGITQPVGFVKNPFNPVRVGPVVNYGTVNKLAQTVFGKKYYFGPSLPPTGRTGTNYVPLSGIQVQFFAAGTNILFLTTVSNINGVVAGTLPPGSYDVKFYGGQITPDLWLTGNKALAVGVSDSVSRFGDTGDDISQAADFTSVKNTFASMAWVGYMVVEDFTTRRAQFRNEASDGTDVFAQSAIYNFGRLYRGLSYIDFIGVGLSPQPV